MIDLESGSHWHIISPNWTHNYIAVIFVLEEVLMVSSTEL